MSNNNLSHLSTSTPASNISSADFARNDGGYSDELNVPSLDDIMRQSPVAALLGINKESLPEEEDDVPTPEDSSEKDTTQEADENAENDLDDEKQEDADKEATDEDDKSTQDSELPSEEDIDWEYKVPVTIDGKTEYKTLEEIRKGYSTDQHLSQRGREIGELKKQIEQERTQKLEELITLGGVINTELTQVETGFQQQYHKLSDAIEKAREEGNTYEVRELKEKREAVQEQYWAARNKREQSAAAIARQWQQQQEDGKREALAKFSTEIKELVPDFSDKVANSIREFAIKEGIPAEVLEMVYDPRIVKFINDYRKLKTAKDTGEMKRKATTTVKSVPTKKGTPQSQREREANTTNRQKVLSGNGSKNDELDFLKRISSVSKKL
jgi:hypothetical protein